MKIYIDVCGGLRDSSAGAYGNKYWTLYFNSEKDDIKFERHTMMFKFVHITIELEVLTSKEEYSNVSSK
jgi:hypothetical protein